MPASAFSRCRRTTPFPPDLINLKRPFDDFPMLGNPELNARGLVVTTCSC